jgi:MFS family permease
MHYGLFLNLIFGFANTFSLSLGGFLENYIGFFYTIIVGVMIVFITNLVFIFQQNIWLCYFLCMFFGIGAGISTSLLGKNLILYVPEKKGIVSGIIGMATIIFCAIFSVGGEKLINPKGEDVNDDDLYREGIANKTYIYFIIGECFIPIGLIIFLLYIYEYKKEDNSEDNSTQAIKEENNDKVNEVDNKEEEKKEDNPNKEEGKLNLEITKKKVKQVIKTCRFWKITLISFFINFAISFMINTGRTFGAIIGINGNALQFAGMFQLLAVIAMVPTLGKGVDKKGPLPFLRIISIVCIL